MDNKPKAHPDSELTESQVSGLYDQLVAEKSRVNKALRRHVESAVEDTGDSFADEADLSARSAEQAYILRYADKEYKLLSEINRAIEKMENAEYGVCEGTEEPIPFKRLEARPWARYSVEYKEMMEREGRR